MLHAYAIRGQTAAAKLLLNMKANPSPRDQDLATPLHKAAGVGDLEFMRLLLDMKADVDERDGDGDTPLHICARADLRPAVHFLVNEANADMFIANHVCPLRRPCAKPSSCGARSCFVSTIA